MVGSTPSAYPRHVGLLVVGLKSLMVDCCSPGRWYASAVMQHFFVHLLTKYNFKLENPKADLTYTYTTIVFPRPGLEILLRER